MGIKYKDSEGNFKEIKIKTKDSLPVGTIVDYDGNTVPDGYEEVEDTNNIYSTEEVIVGKWFGKPLYRKCFQLNIESSMGTTAFTHNIANIDEYTPNCKGIIKRTENRAIPVPFIYLDDTKWSTGLELNNDSFGVDVGSKLREQLDTSSNYNCIVVLEYTKTTDTEGV